MHTSGTVIFNPSTTYPQDSCSSVLHARMPLSLLRVVMLAMAVRLSVTGARAAGVEVREVIVSGASLPPLSAKIMVHVSLYKYASFVQSGGFVSRPRWLRTDVLMHISSYPSCSCHSSYLQHRFHLLTSQRMRTLMRCHEIDSLLNTDLPAILKPRVPGTESHREVKEVSGSKEGCCSSATQGVLPPLTGQEGLGGKAPDVSVLSS